jgi:hypothetical protein
MEVEALIHKTLNHKFNLVGVGSKTAAINPALIADDVLDAYLQYNAARNNLRSKKRRKNINKATVVKHAGIDDYARYIEPWAEKVLSNPRVLLPSVGTLATIGAGVGASMYGPEWAGGPSEKDISEGKRFSPKRALKSTLAVGTVGKAMATAPVAAYRAVSADKASDAILHGFRAVPGAIAAAGIGLPLYRGEAPDMKAVMKTYGKSSTLSLFAGIGGAVAMNPDLQEAIRNMANAAEAPTPRTADIVLHKG